MSCVLLLFLGTAVTALFGWLSARTTARAKKATEDRTSQLDEQHWLATEVRQLREDVRQLRVDLDAEA